MPLTMAKEGETNVIKKIGGCEETRRFLEGLAYVVSLCIYQIGMLFTGAFGIGTIVAFLLLAGFLYLLVSPGTCGT